MSETDDPQMHGRLGRLFAALVGTDDDDEPARAEKDGAAGGFDLDELARSLASASDPAGVLRAFAAGVQERSSLAEIGQGEAPSGLELYLAERLIEAGVLASDAAPLPALRVVRPRTSDLFYLRVEDEELPWLSKVRLIRVEAALNAALLASRTLPEGGASATLEEVVRCEQRTCRSIVAQAPSVAARREGTALGEWDVREAISFGIESFQLPYRLSARFRVNVAAGVAAFEVDLVPPRAWASTVYVDGLGIVGATSQMRRRAATDYNLRMGVLLAAYALAVAPRLSAVWVAGVVDTASSHACYYSCCLTRHLLEGVDLSGAFDPVALMRAAGATIDEDNRELSGVRQDFSLDDELFCPARRFEPVELSSRTLMPQAAEALGCEDLRGLAIDEDRARRSAADDLARELGSSTEQNVRALLGLAQRTGEKDVREAAQRCVQALIDGNLEDDPLAIAEALVFGDELTRRAERSEELLHAHDAEAAEREALAALAATDDDAFCDEGTRTWRAFGDYADRALYNRLLAHEGEKVKLAPSSLPQAHLIASAAELVQEKLDQACRHARRCSQLVPLSTQASMQLVTCLEATGDLTGASAELSRLLSVAHDPETIAFAYLRMAQIQWQGGRVLAAQACYQRACREFGTPLVVAGLAVVALIGHVGNAATATLTAEQVESALRGANIPIAPTEDVVRTLAEAARAAVDTEAFPVARDVTRALCSLVRDDVTFGVLRSLESEPDR